MANDLSLQVIVHAGEASRLLLSNALHGNARHHTDDVAYVINGHGHPLVFAVLLPLELGLFELVIQRSLRIPQASGFFIALRTNHPDFFLFDVFNLLFNLNDFIGDIDVVQMDAGTHLVHGIDRLVGQVPIGDVPRGEVHASVNGFRRVGHAVVFLVLVLDVVQDLNGFIDGCGLDQHLLEAALKGSVLFNVLAVFVQGGSSDALDLAAGECRLEHVGSIEGAACSTSTNNGVNLVNEQDHVGRLLQFVHHGLHTFFKLPAVLCSSDEGCDVERYDAFVEQDAAHFLFDNAQGQSFGDGAFTNPWLTDEDGVVLLAAGKNLRNAFDFLLASHNGIQTAFLSHLRQVSTEVVQDRRFALGVHFSRGTSTGTTKGITSTFFFAIISRFCSRSPTRLAFLRIVHHTLVFLFRYVVVDVKGRKGLGSNVVLVFEDAEQQVLRANQIGFENLRLEVRDF